MQPSISALLKIPDHSENDKLMNILLKEEVLGTGHRLKKVPPGELPYLTPKQITFFTRLLLREVDVLPDFLLPAWKILRKVQKLIKVLDISPQDYLQCVGSAETAILESDPDYYKTLVEKLIRDKSALSHLHTRIYPLEQIKDLDIRIKLPETNAGKNQRLKALLISWIAEKVFKKPPECLKNKSTNELFSIISKTIAKKFCNPYEQGPRGNRFMLISLGEKELCLDIVLEANLKRTKILSPDDGQLPFNIVKLGSKDKKVSAITLTHLPYHSIHGKIESPEHPQIRPAVKYEKMYRIILDRILKIVHFPKMSTMDYNGWFKLIQYYVKGYRSIADESLLFEKVISWVKEDASSTKLSENELELAIAKKVAAKILDFRHKHYSQNPNGSLTYLLNSILSLYRLKQTTIIPLILTQLPKDISKSTGEPEIFIIISEWLNKNPKDYEILFNLIQLCYLFALNKTRDEISAQYILPTLTFNSGKPAIQLDLQHGQWNSLTLMTTIDIKQALINVMGLLQKNPKLQDDADNLLSVLLKGTTYKDKSFSIVHPYLAWLRVNSSFFNEQFIECVKQQTPFFKRLSEELLQISETFEDYQKSPISYEKISRAWDSLELHSKLGFKQELHSFFRPHINTLLQATLSFNEDRNAFFWNLFKVRNLLDSCPWIYQSESIEKHNILNKAIDSILATVPHTKMSLDGFLQAFLKMQLEDYILSTSTRDLKGTNVVQNILKVLQRSISPTSPLNDQLKVALVDSLPSLIDVLGTEKQWSLLLKLRKELHLHKISYPEIPSTLFAFFSAFYQTLEIGKLSSDQQVELIEFLKFHAQTLTQGDVHKQPSLLEKFENIFKLLLEQHHEENAVQLLNCLSDINLESYHNCCGLYLQFTESHPEISDYTERCLKILSSNQKPWIDLQQLKPDECKHLAENIVRKALSHELKLPNLGTALILIKRFKLTEGDIWKGYFQQLIVTKDRALIDNSWCLFLYEVLQAEPSSSTSSTYVQCWLKGISVLNKQDPTKLGSIFKFYKSLQAHLSNVQDSLRDDVHLTVLQILSDYDCSQAKKNTQSELFANLYALYQNSSTNRKDIEIALLTVLSRSHDIEYLSKSIPRIEKYIDRYPDDKTIFPIVESLYLAAGHFTLNEHELQLDGLGCLYEKTNTMPLNWVSIIDVFAQHKSPSLVIRALNQVAKAIQEPGSNNVKLIDVQPKSIIRILTHLCDENTPLVKMPIPAEHTEAERKILSADYLIKAGFAILTNMSVINLLKHENVKELWFKIYTSHLQELINSDNQHTLIDEIQHSIFNLAHAPEALSTDPKIQDLIIELLKRALCKDFERGMLAETLFLHYALGREKGLTKFPLNRVDAIYPDPKNITILNPNRKAPYVNFHWLDAYIQFETKWLKFLISEIEQLDLTQGQGICYLNYIETRIALMLTKPKASQFKKLRDVIDSYLHTMIARDKSEAIENHFLKLSMVGMTFSLKEHYLHEDPTTYHRYQTYLCVMFENFHSKGPEDSLIRGGKNSNYVESQNQILLWTISQITNRESGVDVCYAWKLFGNFAKKGSFIACPHTFKDVLLMIFGVMKKGSTKLQKGQTINHVLKAYEDFLKTGLSPRQGEPPNLPMPLEIEKFILEIHDEFISGLLGTSRAFAETRTETFHPLEACLNFLANVVCHDLMLTEEMIKTHFNTIRTKILEEVCTEIKWCIENRFNKRAEILRLKYFSLLQTKTIKISEDHKKGLALLALHFSKKIFSLFPITSTHYRTSVDLASKIFNLAKLSHMFDDTPRGWVEELETSINSAKK